MKENEENTYIVVTSCCKLFSFDTPEKREGWRYYSVHHSRER